MMPKPNAERPDWFYQVLILEPQSRDARALLESLAARNARGSVAVNAAQAIELAERQRWHLAFVSSDFPMGDSASSAQAVWSSLRRHNPEMPLIMVCQPSDAPAIPAALQSGCAAALQKPLSERQIAQTLDRFLPMRPMAIAAAAPTCGGRWLPIVGRSAALAETLRLAQAAAPTSLPVLLTGPSGSGKELVAGFIHSRSRRADGPMVHLNCAALNESLLESELFGHEKGAFTGAIGSHRGRLERANGGTLLLDEITETPPGFQAKLLRALEQMRFERVGGKEPIQVNVRIISTTNRDIRAAVACGQFRADLYYRLAGLTIPVPPLAARREDIADLVWWFVGEFACQTPRAIQSIEPDTLAAFERYAWPGNIRQLRNAVGALMVFGSGPVLSLRDCPSVLEPMQSADATVQSAVAFDQSLEQLERQAILAALARHGGNRTQAARQLGISDRTLRDKVKKYAPDAAVCAAGA